MVLKGKRKGVELTWASIVGGEAALATALNASLASGALHRPLEMMPRSMSRSATKH